VIFPTNDEEKGHFLPAAAILHPGYYGNPYNPMSILTRNDAMSDNAVIYGCPGISDNH